MTVSEQVSLVLVVTEVALESVKLSDGAKTKRSKLLLFLGGDVEIVDDLQRFLESLIGFLEETDRGV